MIFFDFAGSVSSGSFSIAGSAGSGSKTVWFPVPGSVLGLPAKGFLPYSIEEPPRGGAPPPHVFGVRALCGLLEVWQHSALMSGVLLQSWVMSLFLALFLARSRQFLARSQLFSASWGQMAVVGASWCRFGSSWTRLWHKDGTKN